MKTPLRLAGIDIEDADGERPLLIPDNLVEIINRCNDHDKIVSCLKLALEVAEKSPRMYSDQMKAYKELMRMKPYELLRQIGEE